MLGSTKTLLRHIFSQVKPIPPDPILGLVAKYKQDPRKDAVNLAQGAYRDDNGRPFVLNSLKLAEAEIIRQLNNGEIDKEYLGIEGNSEFRRLTAQFAFGEDIYDCLQQRLVTVQSLSGTGALRLAADSLSQIAKVNTIFCSDPSWGNHSKIFQAAGLVPMPYRYVNASSQTLDFIGMCDDLSSLPQQSVVLLHAAAHNPTGVDPNIEQWNILSDIFARRQLIPLFDSAYQGFASGDSDVDAFAIRLFAQNQEINTMIVCQSYAKNMGLYGERIGALNVVCETSDQKIALMSQIKQRIIRTAYSSPPLHGSRIACCLLTAGALNVEWKKDLVTMAHRIQLVRTQLVEALESNPTNKKSWQHISDQIGMFAYTGLTGSQVDELLDVFGIYLTRDGRMSLAGLKSSDVKKVAAAMVHVCEFKSTE
jgi:aspartate/tyrosine/aromatic aminotransferase